MLPFLKNKEEGSVSGPIETLERSPDEDPAFDMLDAVAEDLMDAIKKGDKAGLKAALAALCDHIQMMDADQDAGLPPV